MYEQVYLNSASFGPPGSDDHEDEAGGDGQQVKDKDLSESADPIVHISHNSILNCLFILTKSNRLILYDCHSRVVLRTIDWSRETRHLQDKYLNPGRLKDTSNDRPMRR